MPLGGYWRKKALILQPNATDFLCLRRYTCTITFEGGKAMEVYLDVLMLLNFMVDLLLMVGTNRLSGHSPGCKRALPAAAMGGIYGGACLDRKSVV